MANLPKIILNFYEVNRSDTAKVGSKGANLGELAQLGVPISSGFIVSSDAYFYFLDMSNVKDKIKDILEHTNIENNEELNKAASLIEEIFIKSKIPPVIEHDISRAYSKLSGFSDTLVAVRSSSTSDEATHNHSLNTERTYLNVKGKKELMLAIKAAWSSVFDSKAIYNRHIKKLDQLSVGVAIPIQKMIQSEISGEMFTIDPVTNDVSRIIIEAVLGLGEAFESGDITPDHYVLNKETLAIADKNISKQEWMYVRKPRSKAIIDANQKVTVSSKWQNSQKIDDRSLVTLANIGRVIEAHYGYPQDMEWAIEKGKVWILHSKPVTTIKMDDDDKFFEERVFEEVKKVQVIKTL